MKISSTIDEGTVLAIPIRTGEWALSQVLYPGVKFYLGIGLKAFGEPLSADLIEALQLELFSWTNDAEVYKGNWINLGVHDIIYHGSYPEYRITIEGQDFVEDFFGNTLRRFNPAKDVGLRFRKVRSPLLVQDAVRAAVGTGEWLNTFEEMRL